MIFALDRMGLNCVFRFDPCDPREWADKEKKAVWMGPCMDRITEIRSMPVAGIGAKRCVDGPHGSNHGNSIHTAGREIDPIGVWMDRMDRTAAGLAALPSEERGTYA